VHTTGGRRNPSSATASQGGGGGGGGVEGESRLGAAATTTEAAAVAAAAEAAAAVIASGAVEGAGGAAAGTASTPEGHIPASAAATASYPKLPDLPLIVGNVAVTGKRDRAAAELESDNPAPPSPPPTARTFTVTAEMVYAVEDKVSGSTITLTKKDMGEYLLLMRHFYDALLDRHGSNTPYHPLLPRAAVNVSVDLKAFDHNQKTLVPLLLKNSGQQSKNATCALLFFMLFDAKDHAYEWLFNRLCEGMRAPKGRVGVKPRKARNKKGGAINGGGQGGGNGGAAAGGGGAGGGGHGSNGGGVGAADRRGGGPNGLPHGGRGLLARYVPHALPPVVLSNEFFVDGVLAGLGRVHLEFEKHHGCLVPSPFVSAFFLSATSSGAEMRYPHDEHPSFCLERGNPQITKLGKCVSQRVVWPTKDIGYVPFSSEGTRRGRVLLLSPTHGSISFHRVPRLTCPLVLHYVYCGSPRVELWSGQPGPKEKVLATALVSRVVSRMDVSDAEPMLHGSAAVEVFDAVFEEGCTWEDYEASDLLYGSDAYRAYATEHFQGLGVPSILGRIADLTNSSSFPVRFLWCASFLRRKG